MVTIWFLLGCIYWQGKSIEAINKTIDMQFMSIGNLNNCVNILTDRIERLEAHDKLTIEERVVRDRWWR